MPNKIIRDYRWRPIEDLPENWPELASPELPALSTAWQKYSEKLRDSDSLKHLSFFPASTFGENNYDGNR
jgi:hypothetical protein